MPRNQYYGGIIGGSPFVAAPLLWTPSDLTYTPYLWVDGNQGLTNQGDGGTLSISGYTTTGAQNGLTTRENTGSGSGQKLYWPEPGSPAISTTVALVKGDSGWLNRQYATMFSSQINGAGDPRYYPHHGGVAASNTKVLSYQFSTVSTMAHTRIDGAAEAYVNNQNQDWGDRSTDWRLYVLQAAASNPWQIGQFGSERHTTGREFTGEVAEILALEEELSIQDIEKVEGYLMHRWGLASLLPSGHTYKSAAPTV